MLKVGLTGGIGSGKTVVANIFRQLGVPVYDADIEARMLTETNDELKKEIKNTFGKEFFNEDDSLNRNAMAVNVFSDKEKLAQLNEIIHPFVRQHFAQWLKQHEKNKYIIKEAAILFESGSYRELDKIISVEAPEAHRIERVMERDNSSKEKILSVRKNQWNDAERKKHSDYAITNDNSVLAIPQVLKLHEIFSKNS